MTRDQHQAILAFIENAVSGPQPPMDVEADAIIRALFVRNPDAAYRMTIMAMALTRPDGLEKTPAQQQAEQQHKSWLMGLFDRRSGVSTRRREPAIT